jgi:RNA polymerase sigma-70 factor (ECF subfamily)
MEKGASQEPRPTPDRSRRTFTVALLASHNDAEWQTVWYTFQRRLDSFFMRKGFRDSSSDCVQETFLRAFRFIGGFRAKGSECTEGEFAGWLWKIAEHVAYDEWRKVRIEFDIDGDDAPDIRQVTEAFDDLDRHLDFERAIAELPAGQREAIELIFFNDLSFAEAAQATGETVGTLKMRVQRAKASLRRRLDDGVVNHDNNPGAEGPNINR